MTETLSRPPFMRLGVLITLLVVVLFVVRMAGPSDLIDFGQEAPVTYTLDVIKNRHWIVQVESPSTVVILTDESESPQSARVHFTGQGMALTEDVSL
jgi:hypothetical protein